MTATVIKIPARWHNLPEGHLLTRAEIELVTGISKSVLCAHSYAGLLPFIPGKPVHHRLGDFLRYAALVGSANGSLHRSLRVEHADRQAYSVLHGVAEFTAFKQDELAKIVHRETGLLWKKYKEQQKAKRKREARKSAPTKKAA